MIKKCLLILLATLFCNQFVCAMGQTKVMPNKEKLEKYFLDYELSYFARHTDLIYKLADHKLSKDEIVKIATEALGDYRIHLQTSMLSQDSHSSSQYSPLYDFFDEEGECARKQLDLCIDKIWAEIGI